MHLYSSFDTDFDTLMLHLEAKYGRELFDIDGIGKQTDINEFSKQFFMNKTNTADVSVDANANVDNKDMISYNVELPKSMFRLNAYYLLWKKLRQLYGKEEANRIVEKQLTGEIYINDFHGLQQPYSYHPDTRIVFMDNDENVMEVSMENLFSKFESVDLGDREQINLQNNDYYVLDKHASFVKLKYIIRHKPHNNLLTIKTIDYETTVTEDHPVILNGDVEKPASDIKKGDVLLGAGFVYNDIEDRVVSTVSDYSVVDINTNTTTPDYVYDITTESGTFYSQGLVQHNCFNYSTYDIALEGLKMVHKIKSVAPKYLQSFKSQLEQFTMVASNSTLGATGLADMLIVMSYYIDNIFKNGHDAGVYLGGWFSDSENEQIEDLLLQMPECNENNQDEIDKVTTKIKQRIDKTGPHNERVFKFNVWKYVKENLVSFVYTINQPGRSGLQSPFTNVSVYDNVFLDKLVDDYKFITDDEVVSPDKKTVKKVQELFIDVMNQELERTPVTFPVTTACLATKEPGKNVEEWVEEKYGVDNSREDRFIIDNEFKEFIAKKNLKWGFINIYQGDSSTLSSCCFYGDEVIEVFNKDTEMKEVMSIGDFVSLYTTDNSEMKIEDKYQILSVNPDTLENEMVNVSGVLKKENEYNKLLKITVGNQTIKVTPDHIFLVKDKNTGEVKEVEAQNLELKYMVPMNNEFVNIKGIEETPHTGAVYDIELERNHYFAANNIVSHNCRLRSDMSELNELNSNLIGGGSTKIGSLGVVTVNFPRLAWSAENEEDFFHNLRESVETVAKINNSKRHIIRKRIDKNAMPLYTLGYMDLRQQFMTYGVNGLNECLEILGYDILTEEGKEFALKIIHIINEENNKQQKKYKAPFNCEQTPSENSAIKMAKKDKLLKWNNDEYSIYSNQFIPLTTEANLLDRVYLQGVFDKHFSGGSIMHANVEQQLETTQQMVDLIDLCAEKGVIYWAVNYNLQECKNGHISVAKGNNCPVCGEEIEYNYTRVVGFLTKVASWAKERREEDYPNREFYTV